MSSIASPEQLRSTLNQLLQPNSQVIKHAEAQLRAFTKHPDSVPGLLQQIVEAEEPAIRQLAAVLLRRRIAVHWSHLSGEQRTHVRKNLEQRLMEEETWLVCKAVAGVVAAVAKVAVPDGEWPHLLDLLLRLSRSHVESHRRAALTLFTSFLEHLGHHFVDEAATLGKVFHQGLQDTAPTVCGTALHALASFVPWLEFERSDHMDIFRELLDPLTQFLRRAAGDADASDLAVKGLEVVDEYLSMPEDQVGDTAVELLRFVLDLLASPEHAPAVRQAALFSVQLVVQEHPRLLVRHDMVKPLVHLAAELFREGDLDTMGGVMRSSGTDGDEDGDGGDDTSTYSPVYMGNVLLDDVALVLPSQYVYPYVTALAQNYVQDADPSRRRAACLAIGVSAEGCAERMSGDVAAVVELLVGGLRDGSPDVREAACIGLLQGAQHLQPGMAEYHGQVMPALFTTLEDQHRRVVERACATLDAYCESLGDDINAYLEHLMQKMLGLLHSAPLPLQEVIISTVSSAAAAASRSILPYMEQLLGLCQQILSSSAEETLSLRARTIEGVGLIAVAAGQDAFTPYLETFMEAALRPFVTAAADQQPSDQGSSSMVLGDIPPELGEYTFGFFANIAQTVGTAFEPYLGTVVPLLQRAAEGEDIVDVSGAMDGAMGLEEATAGEGTTEDGDDENGDEEQDFDAELQMLTGGEGDTLRIRTAALQEKSSAFYALGVLAGETGKAFLPYVEETMRILTTHFRHFHEEIRQNIMMSLRAVLSGLLAASYNPSELHHMVSVATQCFTKILLNDADKAAVARAAEGITFVGKRFGRQGVAQYENDIMLGLSAVLKQEANCQQYQEEEEEAGDHDYIAMDSVSECFDNMAVVMGPDFEPYFRALLPALFRYTHPQRSESDHLMAMGTFGEVCRALGSRCSEYIEVLWPVVTRALKNSHHQMLLRNTVYTVGSLFAHGGSAMQSRIPEALELLYPRFNTEHNEPETIDNAASAVCHMLMHYKDAMPVSKVLPVLLSVLPIRADFLEAPTAYECISWLLHQTWVESQHKMDALRILAAALNQEQVSSELKYNIASQVAQFRESDPSTFNQALESMSPNAQQSMMQAVGISSH
eukprot:gb/GECH01000090.1/.p1 GENE.gb/GECH01000090.1/~~gb/GECH01000090.1/.p1  ORF type:complete len:1109 (+),score=268.88 gb/GECH01000090.1/:1-3327(+)